jgi:outer membrane protein OmpA-like peptidoglycan-associated protein
MTLSNNRAKSVVQYLQRLGIDASRMVSQGYGETKPVGDNATDEGRALNRRVEFKLIR